MATDVCVPISNLAEAVGPGSGPGRRNWGLQAPMLGHVGDGNFHATDLSSTAAIPK